MDRPTPRFWPQQAQFQATCPQFSSNGTVITDCGNSSLTTAAFLDSTITCSERLTMAIYPSRRTFHQWIAVCIFAPLVLATVMGCNSSVASNPGTGGMAGDNAGGSNAGTDGGIVIKQLALGSSDTCALLSNGTVKCWGYNSNGQIGESSVALWSPTPVLVQELSNVEEVAMGSWWACARGTDGTAKCWGQNIAGVLGDGTTSDSWKPVVVQGVSTALQISSTCALLRDGTVTCWGPHVLQAGDGGTTASNSTQQVVEGLAGAVQIAGVGTDICGLFGNGTVKCYGYNMDGQLGDGTTTNSPAPVFVQGISDATELADECALSRNGTAKCWGLNTYGELGDGTANDSSTPVLVQGVSGAVKIDRGGGASCAILSDATGMCWGGNWSGKRGDGTKTK